MGKLAIAISAILLTLNAHGFGYSGRDGENGSKGINGRNGEDVTIVADGEFKFYSINGTDAGAGRDGQNGANASSCSQPMGYSNEHGADGGDGGNGGRAGVAGRGGDALIYYKDINDLQSITLESLGGYGNYGGRGAYGGGACKCSTYHWSRKVCSTSQSCTTRRVCRATGQTRTGDDGRTAPVRICENVRSCTPVTTCNNVSYSCYDGDDGKDGSDGANSSEGRMGYISLVKNLERLPDQLPEASASIATLENGPLRMSKRIWEQKIGATSLFSPESKIRNDYREYVRLAQRDLVLDWNSPSSVENFGKNEVKASFDGKIITYKIVGDDFIEQKAKQLGSKTVIEVTRAFKKDQLTKLEVDSLRGHGKGLELVIKDKESMSLIVKNKVSIDLKFKRRLIGNKKYSFKLSDKDISVSENEIVIHIGQLDIKDKFLKKKRKLESKISVERIFAGKSEVVNLKQEMTRIK